MMKFNKLGRTLSLVMLAVALAVQGCTTTDDTLGGNIIPDNQQMKAGYMEFPNTSTPRDYIETRLFKTDSVKASNISYGYMGSETNDTLGMRKAEFLSQMINYYAVDEGYFGYKPIFDSAQLLLSISTWGRDTVTEQTFGVYEIISNDYITKKPLAVDATERDSVYYIGFDALDPNGNGNVSERVYDPSKPLFTFKLGGKKGPSTTAVTLDPTAEGRAYVRRLMLQEGKYKGDYSIYSTDSLKYWMEEFRGLVIRPENEISTAGKGSIYSTSLSGTGLAIYGRNRREEDPSLVKDTIGMVYYFYDQYAEHGNLSVNSISHDYTKAGSASVAIVEQDALETNENRPENPRVYVEGMGGVVTEITFTEQFFNDLDKVIERENQTTGKEFKTLAFSQVRMAVYFADSDYEWSNLVGNESLIADMESAPERLGLYTNYKTLTGIADYNYLYEENYGTELNYGGRINRSRGCYIMDITGNIQLMWNRYVDEKAKAKEENREVNLDNISNRRIYLGLEAYSLFTSSFCVLQGVSSESGSAVDNNAPIRFYIAYNMIK